MYFNETYTKVCSGTNLSNAFPIDNGVIERDTLLPLLFNFTLKYVIRKVQESQEGL
jgi:hypothetical protein